MSSNNNIIIAIDGHDGSGKTTLAKLLAEKLGGIYIRPFGGDAGLQLIGYADKKDYKNVSLFGNQCIRKYAEAYSSDILIFDRHWMTVFSLLPESDRKDATWYPLPLTTLCFSDLEHTLARLQGRTEKGYDKNYHAYYLDLYLKLGLEFNANILRTDRHSIEECIDKLMEWYQSSQKYGL